MGSNWRGSYAVCVLCSPGAPDLPQSWNELPSGSNGWIQGRRLPQSCSPSSCARTEDVSPGAIRQGGRAQAAEGTVPARAHRGQRHRGRDSGERARGRAPRAPADPRRLLSGQPRLPQVSCNLPDSLEYTSLCLI